MTPARSLPVKLDAADLSNFRITGDNFPQCKTSWTAAFKVSGLWTLVKGDRTDGDSFEEDDAKALMYLISAVDGDLLPLVTSEDTAAELWTKLSKRCSHSNPELARALNPMTRSDTIKSSFFLTTLPDSMDTIIDNLSTSGRNTFQDIESKMLDIASRTQDDQSQAGYYTNTARKASGNNPKLGPQSNPSRSSIVSSLSF
ncbi:hypothetical protein GMORB2_0887 [Geosmithia morbida]|uniref:Uncharacterized protein n=1 Tax=Geosmithia morbida TaxID=1094350 RepID=A0A9P5D2Z8_9HYPO|nr:uncharacterized protein GMORB2_0887 [Geosmithia morbida]KAF4125643.1 hypothetical protein GMORB2_0887 [Geosmithia morbida]